MPKGFFVQDLWRRLPAAKNAMPWRKMAGRAATTLVLLAGWLALCHALRSFLGEQPATGGLTGKILGIYLKHWQNIRLLGAFWCVAIWAMGPLWRAMQTPRFSDRVVGVATPGALGAIRVLACGILLLLTLTEDLRSTALLPRAMVNPLGFMELLHLLPIGFDAFLANETALRAFQLLTVALLTLGLLGLGTRLAIPAAAICCFVLGGIFRGYSFMYHQGVIPLYVLAVLSFTRCGQGWALDRLWRQRRGKPVPPAGVATAYFGWARFAVWTVIALPYMAGAGSKLWQMGLGWASADNMRWVMLRPSLELAVMGHDFDVAPRLVSAPDALLVALAVFVLALQLFFGLVLVSRRARLILPAAAISFHIGVLILMNILFIDLILLHLLFYDFSSLKRWLAGWLGADGRLAAAVAGPAPGRPTETHRRGAFAALALMGFAASWWLTQIVLYPLTPVAMFTAHKAEALDAGLVSYTRAVAHYEDGSSARAPFERWIGAMQRGRWRPAVRETFRDAAGLEKGKQFLDAMIRAADAEGDGARLSSLELQLWRWNFRDDPHDPDQGALADRYIHPANPRNRNL